MLRGGGDGDKDQQRDPGPDRDRISTHGDHGGDSAGPQQCNAAGPGGDEGHQGSGEGAPEPVGDALTDRACGSQGGDHGGGRGDGEDVHPGGRREPQGTCSLMSSR